MPELPEVARTAKSLHQAMAGSQILEVKIHSGRYSRHGHPEGLDGFSLNLPVVVNSVSFKGKFILFTASNPVSTWYIWNTLGMSGSWKKERSKHGHVEFVTEKESFFFTDMRNFGTLKFVNSLDETIKKLNTIGPDHLSSEISDSHFKERLLKRKNATLAEVLMDQKIIGGIGNYIKAEVLYRARISPHRIISDLSDEDFSLLNKSTKEVVTSSFLSRGATIKTYSGMDGEKGDFVFSFKVYGRKTCDSGYTVQRETTKDGRTTHWVPEIQR